MDEEIDEQVLDRFNVLCKLGKGAYGVVWKVQDKINGQLFALKKIFDAFQNSTDAQRTYREVMYLQHLNGHENIIRLLTLIRASNNRDFYLVFELMKSDLSSVIHKSLLKSLHKTFIMYQFFKALKFIHSAGIVHRDLKPSNMLLDSNCVMKLGDFGLARSFKNHEKDSELTVVSDYIATRWYRAPEILLSCSEYTSSVDLWSAGCILAEIFLGKPLFPGKSTLNQLELIIELLGWPSDEDIAAFSSPKVNFVLKSLKVKKTCTFKDKFASFPLDFQNLIFDLLRFNPKKRISAVDALDNSLFARFHNSEEEIEAEEEIILPIEDHQKLSLKIYRDAVYEDISNHLEKSLNKAQFTSNTFKKRSCSASLNKNTVLRTSSFTHNHSKPTNKLKKTIKEEDNYFSKTQNSNLLSCSFLKNIKHKTYLFTYDRGLPSRVFSSIKRPIPLAVQKPCFNHFPKTKIIVKERSPSVAKERMLVRIKSIPRKNNLSHYKSERALCENLENYSVNKITHKVLGLKLSTSPKTQKNIAYRTGEDKTLRTMNPRFLQESSQNKFRTYTQNNFYKKIL